MVKALRSRLLWAGWVLLLAGCGGGGSGEDAQRQPSVFVAQTEFRYERVGDDTARIEETVSIRLTHLPQDGLFVSHGAVPAFLSRLHFEQPSSTQALLHFRVEAARELDPGLHTGELQLHFCRDEACEQPIAGSPVVLSFSYLVTPPPVQHYPEPEEPADPFARLTPLQLYPLAYEVVDSAFSSAMSSVLLLAAEAEPGLVAYGADGAELTRYTLDRPAQRIRLSNDGTLVLVQSGLSLLQVVALQQANGTVLMSPVRQVDLGGFDALDDLAIADDGTLYAVGVRNDSPAALYWLPADETSWHRAEQQVQRSMLWLHPDGLTLYLMSTPGLATGHYSLWSLDRDQGPQWQGVRTIWRIADPCIRWDRWRVDSSRSAETPWRQMRTVHWFTPGHCAIRAIGLLSLTTRCGTRWRPLAAGRGFWAFRALRRLAWQLRRQPAAGCCLFSPPRRSGCGVTTC